MAPPPSRLASLSPIPRLALTQEEAAASLGVSVDYFVEHVRHELRVVRRGRRRIYPVAELERWLDRSASRALEALFFSCTGG